MEKYLLIIFSLLTGILASCENQGSTKLTADKSIDYSSKTILDSLIKVTPLSKDTIFLGFWMGMNPSEYLNQIEKLQSERKTITFSSSNIFTNVAGRFDLGAGYTFSTDISANVSGKTITGEGSYFLEPLYNRDLELIRLSILPIEKWNGDYGSKKPDWLELKILESSEEFSNIGLKQVLVENNIINSYDFLRQRGNVVIYGGISITYFDLHALLSKIRTIEIKKDSIEGKNQDIKF